MKAVKLPKSSQKVSNYSYQFDELKSQNPVLVRKKIIQKYKESFIWSRENLLIEIFRFEDDYERDLI